jgi:hypothetical protein
MYWRKLVLVWYNGRALEGGGQGIRFGERVVEHLKVLELCIIKCEGDNVPQSGAVSQKRRAHSAHSQAVRNTGTEGVGIVIL